MHLTCSLPYLTCWCRKTVQPCIARQSSLLSPRWEQSVWIGWEVLLGEQGRQSKFSGCFLRVEAIGWTSGNQTWQKQIHHKWINTHIYIYICIDITIGHSHGKIINTSGIFYCHVEYQRVPWLNVVSPTSQTLARICRHSGTVAWHLQGWDKCCWLRKCATALGKRQKMHL